MTSADILLRRQRANRPLRERFENGYIPEPNSGCWLWDASYVIKKGRFYGLIKDNKKNITAHRASHQLFIGPLRPGLMVCHTCDVSLCVNPRHLYLGTQTDNMQDMLRRGRSALARLTSDQIRAIFADRRSYSATAKAFGISKRQVGRIRNRESWAHITDQAVSP